MGYSGPLSLLESFAALPQHAFSAPLSYGTAGFRTAHKVLDSAMFRIGVVAGLRARLTGRLVGVMITASHNPEMDNGAKIVDINGGMLVESWEKTAETIVNARTIGEFIGAVQTVINSGASIASGVVAVGRDTRSSSERLAKLVMRGIFAVGCMSEDYGLVSTPTLHHVVRCANGVGTLTEISLASVQGYIEQMTDAYTQLVGLDRSRRTVAVDCAGGVGAVMLEKISCINLEILNKPGRAELNFRCGAEHVQKTQTPPRLEGVVEADRPKVIASFDGDADRLVYSMVEGNWRLMDGDKIAALVGLFIQKQLAVIAFKTKVDFVNVQTAYANGAATKFFETLGIPVRIAKTGVKFVEAVAHEHAIGMYFEANGHGTVVFSDTFLVDLMAAPDSLAKRRLLAFARLINQAVGDAIADLLVVEATLEILGLSYTDWANLYEDLPSRQGKVSVTDRTVIKCSQDETRVLQPVQLQNQIDVLVAKFSAGRAFVRPSGTEDAVRIYAEAATQEEANQLAYEIACVTVQVLGGDKAVKKESFGL